MRGKADTQVTMLSLVTADQLYLKTILSGRLNPLWIMPCASFHPHSRGFMLRQGGRRYHPSTYSRRVY